MISLDISGLYLGLQLAPFFCEQFFAYARSDFLCSLKERMRIYVLTDGYLRYFPGRYSFGFKMHEAQK